MNTKIKTQALARLKSLAAPGPGLQYVHQIAEQVFGPCDFDPVDMVSIAGGVPHIHVIPKKPPTLQQMSYFSKTLMAPGINSVKVQGISRDHDHGLNSIKVEFYTRIR